MVFRWFSASRKEKVERVETSDAHLSREPAETQDNLVIWLKTLGPDCPRPLETELAISRLLADLPAGNLLGLDFDMRWRESWRTDSWESITPEVAAQTIRRSADTVVGAVGLSMHRNGHVREVAVKALAESGDQRAIPWLVLRAGDWVEEVRNRAVAGVEPFLDTGSATQLLEVLPLLDGGRFQRGRAASGLRARVEAVLDLPESASALQSGAASSDKLTRRYAVRLLTRKGANVELLRTVIETGDVVSIALVSSGVPFGSPSNQEVGELLLSSTMARFRSEGLWRVTRESRDANSRGFALQGLIDPAPSVRDVARRWMAKDQPEADVNDFYRGRLTENPLAALRGLGDQASEVDAESAADHLDSDIPAVRHAALRLLARLGRHTDSDLFVDRFLNGSAKERQAALAGLRRSNGAARVAEIWQIASGGTDPILTRRVLYQVVPMGERWLRLSIGLQAAASSEQAVVSAGIEILRRMLDGWNVGYPSKPTLLLGTLRAEFEKARPAIRAADNRRFDQLRSFERSLENLVIHAE